MSQNSEHLVVYITFPDREKAREIASDLVNRRLAVCANILSGHESLYWWDGKVQEAKEAAVILKTRADLFDALEEAVRKRHPYECPCIVSWPITKGHEPFLQWISDATA
jgi:periplasmic divalent cation tolerance protein